MTEPRIQYAKTKDGVTIACTQSGEGKPLVMMSAPGVSIGEPQDWRVSVTKKRKLVRYDGRGTGLSDRDVSDFSLDSLLLDLQAGADRLGLETFTLMGAFHSGPAAIAYTARHPERVSHLILWCTWARTSDFYAVARVGALGTLRDQDWETYTEVMAQNMLGLTDSRLVPELAALLRKTTTQETVRAFVDAARQFDATSLLSQVRSPTLLLIRRGLASPPPELTSSLAARIPDARLVVLEGDSLFPGLGDTASVHQAIDEFLGDSQDGVSGAKQPAGEDIHTLLFTDMEGSTSLTERLGDAKAQELRRAHDTIVRDALKGCGGSETKHTGDGIMASFPSASRAIECAVAIQRGIGERGDDTLRVRIGLNAGEPVAEEADLFGTAVNLARRICDEAEPGQILVSDVVHQLAAGKGFTFADNGEATLKGFEKPVRLHEVKWRDG
jgi:class 3 adenylate cyclase